MDELGAIDLGFKGYRFTWDNGYSGAVLIKNGLDCTIADRDLVNFYQAGCQKVTIKTWTRLTMIYSLDHFPFANIYTEFM